MPAQYDLPEYYGAQSQQDVNLYNKLPFYLALMEAKMFPKWDTYNQLWGKITWKPNMGSTMKGVQAVNTPIGRQFVYPKKVTEVPNKDVFETLERTEQCNVQWQDFDSKQIYFLPSFQDFRTNQIDFAHDDIVRQISVFNDQFIRAVMFQKSPFVYIVGKQAGAGLFNTELIDAPNIPAGTDISQANVTAMGKNTNWCQVMAAAVGSPGLQLSTIDRLVMTLRDDLGAPFYEGTVNAPKDNELIKGKYVITGGMEAFQNLKWDPNLEKFRDINWNIVVDGFYGSIFGLVTWRFERYPLRMKADGTFPVPEIQDNNNDTVVNPEYANAPYEWAFMSGADAYKTIKVGPPPKPFAGGKMSLDQFNGMNWNGEVQLTRDLLVQYATTDGGTMLDTNNRGRFVKLISALTVGCLAVRARNAIPILFQRQRPANQSA